MTLNIVLKGVLPPDDFRNSAVEIDQLYRQIVIALHDGGYTVPMGGLSVEVYD